MILKALPSGLLAASVLFICAVWQPRRAAREVTDHASPLDNRILGASIHVVEDHVQPLPTTSKFDIVERADPRPQHPQAFASQAAPPPPILEELRDWSGCPENYPHYVALGQVLQAWTADEPDPPPEFAETVRIFDFTEEGARDLALKYRDCEVPFKVKNAPEILATSALWTDEYLNSSLWENTDIAQEIQASATSRYMYWRHDVAGPEGWQPPTWYLPRPTFGAWLAAAKDADAAKLSWNLPHQYFGVDEPERGPNNTAGLTWEQQRPGDFVARDMTYFSTPKSEPNFWVPNIAGRSGIQCRFAMRGVTTASHFDNGRNYVAMFRGAKRYLLNPPGTCPYLGVEMMRDHPSYRHTDAFWSWRWPEHFERAAAVDIVVGEGEALYIPSFWFHHVQSLNYSIQCNARSGFPPGNQGLGAVQQCLRLQVHETGDGGSGAGGSGAGDGDAKSAAGGQAGGAKAGLANGGEGGGGGRRRSVRWRRL